MPSVIRLAALEKAYAAKAAKNKPALLLATPSKSSVGASKKTPATPKTPAAPKTPSKRVAPPKKAKKAKKEESEEEDKDEDKDEEEAALGFDLDALARSVAMAVLAMLTPKKKKGGE
ncbi:3cef536a-7e6e-4d67-827b-4cbcb345fcca [Thermothielavioides terrestris]|uniref:3cef536a-7e6e-4d67-827b-4cbcb345fcca n=1 Tax=Thermothielavioides terrestris TaxID=2587410 RepID=A0A446BM62_9PEZI|nr:3cef536a-7e6e-4d67-827b-4cbcb345fcca [Thermothielavioides terrestris]